MTEQTQIILAIVVASVFVMMFLGGGLLIVRRVGRRRFLASALPQPTAHGKACGGNCGCNCNPPPQPGCIPAMDCAPPYAHPIAIHGLSCNPNDPTFAYARDIQMFVDARNRQAELDRQAASVENLEAVLARLKANAPTTKSKP